jgi:hypothetical protein
MVLARLLSAFPRNCRDLDDSSRWVVKLAVTAPSGPGKTATTGPGLLPVQ